MFRKRKIAKMANECGKDIIIIIFIIIIIIISSSSSSSSRSSSSSSSTTTTTIMFTLSIVISRCFIVIINIRIVLCYSYIILYYIIL